LLYWIFLGIQFPLVVTFGATALEACLRAMNRFVWNDDPSPMPSDEQILKAWACQNLQPFATGAICMGALNLLEIASAQPGFVLAEVALPLLAIGATVPPWGAGISGILGISLTRAIVLVFVCTVLTSAAALLILFALVWFAAGLIPW
jgi:hypothetical protein